MPAKCGFFNGSEDLTKFFFDIVLNGVPVYYNSIG